MGVNAAQPGVSRRSTVLPANAQGFGQEVLNIAAVRRSLSDVLVFNVKEAERSFYGLVKCARQMKDG